MWHRELRLKFKKFRISGHLNAYENVEMSKNQCKKQYVKVEMKH